MELKEYIKSVLFEYLSADCKVDIYACIEKIYQNILSDRQDDIELDSAFWSKSTLALVNFRVTNYIYMCLKLKDLALKLSEKSFLETNIYISPKISIEKGFKIEFGENSKIFENASIGSNFSIFGEVTVCSKQGEGFGLVKIGNNVEILDGSSVWGNVSIGDRVKIGANCVVLDDIDSDCEVKISSALQLTSCKKRSVLPSQKLKVYGVVPKFKNQLVIYGDGFYNPRVDLKIKGIKNVESDISYWDKGTIIIKLKPILKLDENFKSKVIIKSNGNKIVIINANGIYKALKQV